MFQSVSRTLSSAVTAAVAVILICSRMVEPTEPTEPTKLNTTWTTGLHTNEPPVLAMVSPCGSEHNGFCLNGICSFYLELNSPRCHCNPTFSGERCEHVLLMISSGIQPEEIVGICCGVLLLLGFISILIYCCYKKRCCKSPPSKNYGQNSV
ncbi:epigen [Hoplias malabaricus]|uniref:epigen n=1 Tax=Hoplias malabaricus TaxID=27720 RepID=UPI0034629522